MASAISTHTFLCSSTQRRSTSFVFTSSLVSSTKPPKFLLSTSTPQLGLGLFSPWTGLKQVGFSIRSKSVKMGRRGRYRGKFYASLFGVGAPEALVIGVVALLVFGPKGLAEVARNLGKTLRAFQPTIRELQDVSREFKSTLEREIGLDDLPPSEQNTFSSSTSRSASSSSSSSESENPDAALDPNGSPPINQPSNIGEFLVAAQLAESSSPQLEEATVEEEQPETPPQPQSQLQSESQTTPQLQSESQLQTQSDSKPQSEVPTTYPEVVTTTTPEVITTRTVTQTVESKQISSSN